MKTLSNGDNSGLGIQNENKDLFYALSFKRKIVLAVAILFSFFSILLADRFSDLGATTYGIVVVIMLFIGLGGLITSFVIFINSALTYKTILKSTKNSNDYVILAKGIGWYLIFAIIIIYLVFISLLINTDLDPTIENIVFLSILGVASYAVVIIFNVIARKRTNSKGTSTNLFIQLISCAILLASLIVSIAATNYICLLGVILSFILLGINNYLPFKKKD